MQASLARAKRSGHAREPRLEDGCTVHIFRVADLVYRETAMPRTALVSLVVGLFLLTAGVASADRKPTPKEKAQIASVVHLPVKCARVRVSTVTKKPKWGSVSWRGGSSICEPLASNGVTVVKKTTGRWRFITAGSSFSCSELYDQVPKAVAKDLGIRCGNF
jgi:hypothetical protein